MGFLQLLFIYNITVLSFTSESWDGMNCEGQHPVRIITEQASAIGQPGLRETSRGNVTR